MNLLGSAAYDPSVAVSKATSALLAMTAVDTTNLRLAITVPAHGKVKFRLSCTVVGATTLPGILLGVLNGATVLKRQAPQMFSGTQDRTTEMATAVAEFVVTGLTPGALSADAAYAVQVIVASTNIKFGGTNDTTGADAWGAFVFEAWDPQPMPLAIAPGAAGGLLIAGANAASTFATMTVTGAFSVNGVSNVSQTGDAFARLGAPVGASTSADVAAVKTDTAAVKVQTDKMAFTVANQIDSNVIDWKSAVAPAMTGDAFARLGVAGAGLTALGDTRIANLDTTVSSRSTYAGGAVASVTAAVTVGTNSDKTGYTLSAPGVQAIWDALTTALTTVGSIGKLLVTDIDAAISSRSTFAGGAVSSVTGAVGSVTGSVGSVTGAVTVGTNNDKTGYALSAAGVQAIWDALTSALTTVGSIGKQIVTNLDAAISSRSTYAGGAVASVTGAVGSVTAAVTVGTNNDKTGYSLTQSFPANFAALGISVGGHISLVDTLTTYTGNVVQTGDAFARIGLAGVGLTNLGDARIANLDATVSSRLASASYTAPPTAAANAAAVWNEATAGHVTAGTFGKLLNDDLDTNIGSRLATSGYTAPDNADIVSIKSTLGVAGAGLTALGDTRIAHLDADVSTRLATSGYTAPPSSATIAGQVWDIVLSGHLTSGTTGAALNGAGAAGDPWTTALPGVYGAGTAGNIVGNRLDAAVSSRLATSGYTAPDNADITSIKTTLGVAGAGLTALGDARVAHLDADVSSRLATAGYTAPDNADITSIKTTLGIAGAGLTALGDVRMANLDAAVSSRLPTTSYTAPDNTDIVAIRAKTDNLPPDPADASDIAALFAALPTAVTVANEVATRTLNANVKEVNSVTIKGDGAVTPWGPV